MGEAFKQNGAIVLPYGSPASTLQPCPGDPLEVWKGKPDLPLSSSLEQPKSRPGDGNRQTVKLNYQNGLRSRRGPTATVDGEVCGCKPCLSRRKTRSLGAFPGDPLRCCDRTPRGEARPELRGIPERTVKMKTVSSGDVCARQLSEVIADKLEVDLLEKVVINEKGIPYVAILLRPDGEIDSEIKQPADQKCTPKPPRCFGPLRRLSIESDAAAEPRQQEHQSNVPFDLRRDFLQFFSQMCSRSNARCSHSPIARWIRR